MSRIRAATLPPRRSVDRQGAQSVCQGPWGRVGPGLEALSDSGGRASGEGLGEIEKSANMIGNGSDKILDGLGVMRTGRRSTGETGHPERCHVIS